MARVDLQNIGLQFRMTRHGPVRMSDWLMEKIGLSGHTVRTVNALQEVTLRLRDGDRLGLVGYNGAGKSTLLKVLAGIYPPTHGQRRVEGRLSSLFNVALGFEPYATGTENIRCQGYLLGETRQSIDRKIDAIAEFSELGEALDMPVRYYSAGMRMRLGFAIATAIEPDILLVDEVINAGDLAFRAKAKKRVQNVMTSASIVVTATHDLGFLRELCNRVLWIDQGHIRADGPPAEVIRTYVQYVYRNHPTKTRKAA